jgi:hypothetical protein
MEKTCTEPADEYIFFYGKGNDNHELCTNVFVKAITVTGHEGP